MRLLLATMLTLSMALAQSSAGGRALNAEYAVPFGTSSGQLLVLGSYLVFVDSQVPESSFVVPRSEIASANADGSTLTLQMSQPVHNRAGDVTQLTFRVTGDPQTVVSWYQAKPQTETQSAERVGGTQETQTFEATHDHLFGSDHGRLVISPDQLAYESVDSPDNSRRWAYSSIRELSQPNPYEIRIKPFSGDEYKLKLGGSGMDPSTFATLVDRVTKARAGK